VSTVLTNQTTGAGGKPSKSTVLVSNSYTTMVTAFNSDSYARCSVLWKNEERQTNAVVAVSRTNLKLLALPCVLAAQRPQLLASFSVLADYIIIAILIVTAHL
jgi:hypothetical protein